VGVRAQSPYCVISETGDSSLPQFFPSSFLGCFYSAELPSFYSSLCL